MPVIVHRLGAGPAVRTAASDRRVDCIHIGLVNNMPDLALQDTEEQFLELLDAASGNIGVHVQFFALPGIPRSARWQQYLDNAYFDLSDLQNVRLDAAIVTGTEPHQCDLRREPYWGAMADVLDWAEENTASTVLSCLAAHAGVLYSDGIGRHHLGHKRFGVFDFRILHDHPLTGRGASLLQFPHSRWNDLPAEALRAGGYQILSESPAHGVDLFVKQKRKSLFVHFQGHPEYGRLTLFKEYRRDVRRFLKRERDDYPGLPCGYFDAAAVELLNDFRAQALDQPSEELLANFPETPIAGPLQHTWRTSAACLYRRWLQYVISKKTSTLTFAAASGMAVGPK